MQLLSVAHGGHSSGTNVVWGSTLCYVHLLSVAAYGGHGRVMRSDKAAVQCHTWLHFCWNLCVKRYRDNEHDEANTYDMFQVE